jgi:hypothetical protein
MVIAGCGGVDQTGDFILYTLRMWGSIAEHMAFSEFVIGE